MSVHNRWMAVVTLTLLLGIPGHHGLAHAPPPDHGCTTPTRPADDQNDLLWQRFLAAVDEFRGCISDYATANHAASEAHREAANAATLDWNRFVRSDLNVPEDFPWPPDDR